MDRRLVLVFTVIVVAVFFSGLLAGMIMSPWVKTRTVYVKPSTRNLDIALEGLEGKEVLGLKYTVVRIGLYNNNNVSSIKIDGTVYIIVVTKNNESISNQQIITRVIAPNSKTIIESSFQDIDPEDVVKICLRIEKYTGNTIYDKCIST